MFPTSTHKTYMVAPWFLPPTETLVTHRNSQHRHLCLSLVLRERLSQLGHSDIPGHAADSMA